MFTLETFRSKLSDFVAPSPYHEVDWSSLLQSCEVNEGECTLTFCLGFYVNDRVLLDTLASVCQEPQYSIKIVFNSKVQAHQTQLHQTSVKGVKNILAVASGKGGVGKTTTAVSLALALKQQGASVGILDADIYGPNVATMLGCHSCPSLGKQGPFDPVVLHGLQTMSMAYLVDPKEPMVWRGPMISKALQQLLHLTQWQELDYLVVDMPPGTGDIPLTMAQKIPLVGSVMVTTPHEAAYADVQRSFQMFNKMKIHALGLVENMASYRCESCGAQTALLGQSQLENHGLKDQCLASVPIHTLHGVSWAKQVPFMENKEVSPALLSVYHHLAMQIAIKIAARPRDYSSTIGPVVVR